MDHLFIKKKYPYNYNENEHKIHLSDREINTIRTVIEATFLAIKWIQHVVFLHKQCCTTGIPVKKKDDKKTKAFYDWATTGIPVKKTKAFYDLATTGIPVINLQLS